MVYNCGYMDCFFSNLSARSSSSEAYSEVIEPTSLLAMSFGKRVWEIPIHQNKIMHLDIDK